MNFRTILVVLKDEYPPGQAKVEGRRRRDTIKLAATRALKRTSLGGRPR